MPKQLPPGVCDDCEQPTHRDPQAEVCYVCLTERKRKRDKAYREANRAKRTQAQRDRRARLKQEAPA